MELGKYKQVADVYLNYRSDVMAYPSSEEFFSPDSIYPEYPFMHHKLSAYNPVYEMIREALYCYGLDRKNFGTKEWNPLGEYIKIGDTVLIKPNWVMHINKTKDLCDDLDCLITHPSVIRAIVDYVHIALKGSGKIIVADAPMQGCNLDEMFKKADYDKLFIFWNRNIPNVLIKDLRKYSSMFSHGVVIQKSFIENSSGSLCVNLGEYSFHHNVKDENILYKISDYSSKLTNKYHHNLHHEYEINRDALEADVIINVPKPKCHRLAGMTAAMKNFVGVTYEKACLPHRKLGDAENNGDSYRKKSLFKELMEFCDELKTNSCDKNRISLSYFFSFMEKVFYVLGTFTSGDPVRVGSWYGNDTIWRTIVDLNMIAKYSDKKGVMRNKPQRKIVCLGDMIVCGQKNGPVSPVPKPLGMIMISDNTVLFDMVMLRIMGFDKNKIKNMVTDEVFSKMGLRDSVSAWKRLVNINGTISSIFELKTEKSWRFVPHDMWKNHIEE